MFVPELTRAYYPDKEALAEDVVALLRAELEELRSAGAEFVQFDEPVLTEVAFAPGRTRTFMCAALAARRDPAEELEFAVSLINRVVAGVDGLRIGLHVCRGNWSRDETTLLERRLPAARGRISTGCRSRSSSWNTPPSGPARSSRSRARSSGWASSTRAPTRSRRRRRFARPSKRRSVSIPPNACS